MRINLACIVEGHCEYDTYPSFISKIIGNHFCPISNAQGIGNIMKNTGQELLRLIKLYSPKNIIITLDYREALLENLVQDCEELKNLVTNNCNEFLESQANGSLTLPDRIVVVVVDKTHETWLIADQEALKENPIIDEKKITQEYENVDIEIENPNKWLNNKLLDSVDLKARNNRKTIAKNLRPEIAKDYSRSFRKFYEEVQKSNLA